MLDVAILFSLAIEFSPIPIQQRKQGSSGLVGDARDDMLKLANFSKDKLYSFLKPHIVGINLNKLIKVDANIVTTIQGIIATIAKASKKITLPQRLALALSLLGQQRAAQKVMRQAQCDRHALLRLYQVGLIADDPAQDLAALEDNNREDDDKESANKESRDKALSAKLAPIAKPYTRASAAAKAASCKGKAKDIVLAKDKGKGKAKAPAKAIPKALAIQKRRANKSAPILKTKRQNINIEISKALAPNNAPSLLLCRVTASKVFSRDGLVVRGIVELIRDSKSNSPAPQKKGSKQRLKKQKKRAIKTSNNKLAQLQSKALTNPFIGVKVSSVA